MIPTFDYHTHTTYSHGKGSILENAESAKEKGLKGICITDHGFSHPAFGMRRRKLDIMRQDCENAEKITGVKVMLGIESNILGVDGKIDVKKSDYDKLDMILAGCHRFVLYDKLWEWCAFFGSNFITSTFNFEPDENLIKRNTKLYINAIKNNPIDILTHLNYLVYADAEEVAKCCRDYGTYLEINTKKTHLSVDEWRKVIDTGVNFVVDSDAHTPSRVGEISLFEELDKEVNFPKDRIFNLNGQAPNFRFSEYKKSL